MRQSLHEVRDIVTTNSLDSIVAQLRYKSGEVKDKHWEPKRRAWCYTIELDEPISKRGLGSEREAFIKTIRMGEDELLSTRFIREREN